MNGAGARRALGVLLAVSVGLNLWGNSWGLPNTNAWHGDAIATETLRLMASGFEGFSKYPAVHHLTLALVFTPFLAWSWITGALDTAAPSIAEAFADPLLSVTTVLIMARVISALMGAAVVLLVHRIVVHLTGNRLAALAGAAVWAFSTEAVLYAHWSNVDVPMVFWFALAFLAWLRFMDSLRPRDGLVLGVLTAVAVSTKEQIGGAFVLMGAACLVQCIVRGRHAAARVGAADTDTAAAKADEAGGAGAAAPGWTGLLWGAAGLVVAYGLLSKLFLDPSGWAERMRGWIGAGTDAAAWDGFANTPAGHLALLRETWNDLGAAMGAPLVWAALLCGLLAVLRPRGRAGARAWWVASALLSYHAFTIGAIRYVYPRFLLPTIFLAAVLLGLGLASLPGRRSGWVAGLLVGAVLLFSAARSVSMDLCFAHDPRYAVEEWMTDNLPPGTPLEVYAYDHYLPRAAQLGIPLDRRGPEAITIESLQQRRPAAVLLVPKSWHRYTSEQVAALRWLQERSGYRRHRFDYPASCSALGPNSLVSDLQEIELLIAPR